ncbi:MAG: N-acetyl-gamma-glutamyl-phosphate reductase [Deltaproteobacteria bacterium]|nr:N-acetyl-gamma-glutamyl-phosphate reductase [Deltaproteobacteria bacterium]MBI2535028.1 N-acetyl-gamma-glutamyl-phosphate reductase [Deltaproteobacteria bacterium]
MRPKIYIDGQAGTTALRIRDWLAGRDDLEVVTLPEALRKDHAARKKALHDATIVLLCLPDDAAREAANWLADSPVRILDASTAHRVTDGWVYGLPELVTGQREQIAKAKQVANPGCYASAVILLARPLVDAGLIAPETPLSIHALSGYSGGGRAMIERWEDPKRGLLNLPHEAPYSIGKLHKHISEIIRYGALSAEPQFLPNVGPFRCGMRVQVMISANALPKTSTGKAMWETLAARYDKEAFIEVEPLADASEADEFTFDPQAHNDTNRISLCVLPHQSGHVLLMARLDNLGKGAAGAAIQNLNLMLGMPEQTGLPR